MKSKNNIPAFIKISHGASVDNLSVRNNTVIGNVNFIDNQGELSGSIVEGNNHIIPSGMTAKKVRRKRPEVIISIIISIISIPWWPKLFSFFM